MYEHPARSMLVLHTLNEYIGSLFVTVMENLMRRLATINFFFQRKICLSGVFFFQKKKKKEKKHLRFFLIVCRKSKFKNVVAH